MSIKNEDLIAALRVLARVERDDMVRLIQSQHWPIPIRPRDSARNMIGLVLDHVHGQVAFDFVLTPPAPSREHRDPTFR